MFGSEPRDLFFQSRVDGDKELRDASRAVMPQEMRNQRCVSGDGHEQLHVSAQVSAGVTLLGFAPSVSSPITLH